MQSEFRREVRNLIRNLVQIESENPPGNEAPCANYIADWFKSRDIDTEIIQKPFEERPQVVATVGTGEPIIVLNGHMDVVSPGDSDQWSYPPYEAVVENNTLYGRGSVDMKAGLGIAMAMLAYLQEDIEEGDLNGTLMMQAVVGGEAAEPGTRTLVNQGYDGDHAIVLEPTNLRTATSEKGTAWYEIIVTGEAVHASRPEKGVSAFDRARVVLDYLDAYDERLREREDELVGGRFATVTQFNTANKEVSVLPEEVTMTLDRRVLPDESVENVDEELTELCSEIHEKEGFKPVVERLTNYTSGETSPDCPVAQTFRKNSHEMAGIDEAPIGLIFSTDMSEFANAGIDAIVWGPGDHVQAHTVDEHIDLDEVDTAFEILERSVCELFES